MKEHPVEPTVTTTRPRPRPEDRPKILPPYHVVLLNDDFHSVPFVVGVLQRVLGISTEQAHQLTMAAHSQGRCVIWTGPKEVAELKVEQVQTFHEIREPDNNDLGPLGCDLEPAPGA